MDIFTAFVGNNVNNKTGFGLTEQSAIADAKRNNRMTSAAVGYKEIVRPSTAGFDEETGNVIAQDSAGKGHQVLMTNEVYKAVFDLFFNPNTPQPQPSPRAMATYDVNGNIDGEED